MHSNIYGLVKIQEPKAIEVEPFNENSIEYDRVSHFADYFKDSEDTLENDVKWLANFIKLSEEDIIFDNGVCILRLTKNKVKEYLERRYNAFMEYVDTLNLEKFINDDYTLKTYVEEEYGFHIYEDDGIYTLDEFMRCLYRWSFKTTDTIYFQINGIVDYHS